MYAAASNDILNDLQTLQNKCLRLCTKSPYDININQLHEIAKVNLLTDRRKTHLLNLMYQRKEDTEYLDIRVLPTRQHASVNF